MDWKTMLAYVTGSVDEDLLRRNEYLVAENRILRAQIPGRLKLTDGERRKHRRIRKDRATPPHERRVFMQQRPTFRHPVQVTSTI